MDCQTIKAKRNVSPRIILNCLHTYLSGANVRIELKIILIGQFDRRDLAASSEKTN